MQSSSKINLIFNLVQFSKIIYNRWNILKPHNKVINRLIASAQKVTDN